jgi:hypothetical protein
MILPLLLLLYGSGPAHGLGERHAIDHGSTITTRFSPPEGFVRQQPPPGSFASWLGAVKVLPPGTPVILYNGDPKDRQDVHAAVLDVSVGRKDLQQCADAVMRLRAEYLFAQRRYSEIHFDLTNGFRAEFERWMRGERIRVTGNRCSWTGGGEVKGDHDSLLSFLETVFTYAGTMSLGRELTSAGSSPVQAGDVFIRGGSPGHAVIVMDVAQHPDGRQAFLIAQSYMPAQQVHVLRNLHHPGLGAWFIHGEDDRLRTPEWTFSWTDRKRW